MASMIERDSARRRAQVIVQRSLPTEPVAHGAGCLYLSPVRRQGVRPEIRLLDAGPRPASEHIATCLRVRPGDVVIARRRLMFADDVPIRLATSYFRADLFGGGRLADPEALGTPLEEAVAALGHTFGHAEETLVARPAGPGEERSLDLDPGEWVVQILRASYSADDTPIHVLETVCAATRHVFTVSQAGGADVF